MRAREQGSTDQKLSENKNAMEEKPLKDKVDVGLEPFIQTYVLTWNF